MTDDIDAKLDRLIDDMQDVKVRLNSLDKQIGSMAADIARIDGRIDGMNKRLDRIKARLETLSTPNANKYSHQIAKSPATISTARAVNAGAPWAARPLPLPAGAGLADGRRRSCLAPDRPL